MIPTSCLFAFYCLVDLILLRTVCLIQNFVLAIELKTAAGSRLAAPILFILGGKANSDVPQLSSG